MPRNRLRPRKRRSNAASVDPADVFINVPFGPSHERLYLALIAGLKGLGLNPRCVVEVEAGEDRLERLLRLIERCAYSLHDLSHVRLCLAGKFRVPRFNMPFELGLAVAVARHSQPYTWRILEKVEHRLTCSLSDLNGFDPYTHDGTAEGTMEALASIFCDLAAPPMRDPADLMQVYRQLRDYRRARLGKNIFAAYPFGELVVAAKELVLFTPRSTP